MSESALKPAGKRLAPLRVLLAAILALMLGVGGFAGYTMWASAQSSPPIEPWFAAYVDVTATPTFEFETPASDAAKDVVLSFIVAAEDDGCEPTWGTAYTLDEAAAELDLDRRLARLQQQGGGIAVSFGGLINNELARTCEDPDELDAAYLSVIERYDVHTIDLDIEGKDLTDEEAGTRRAESIARIQTERRESGQDLAVWLTLPAATSGLTEKGTDAVATLLEAGVDLSVNIMTMNFGQSLDADEPLSDASIRALKSTHRQLNALHRNAGIELSSATLWAKLGATPMVGQNDHVDEVFTLDDAAILNTFAIENGLGRMSMWSLNRDTTCGPNYADTTRVSDSCSGVKQGDRTFAELLAKGFTGRIELAADRVTTAEPADPADLADDPKSSPYPIWSPTASYLKGTKVVWHHNVYQAKWWSKDEVPDNPVLNEWETAWTLIGPVLPGEKPIPVPTLSPGTYPDWAGTEVYEKGIRVLFEGVPFQAKWWNQGESPDAYSSDPDSSAWVPLTVAEIEELLEEE